MPIPEEQEFARQLALQMKLKYGAIEIVRSTLLNMFYGIHLN